MNWLRLIRYKNLLIVFFTQLLVWYCLLYGNTKALNYAYKSSQDWIPGSYGYYISPAGIFLYILLLSTSTVCIAAAGYIINDYFDLKIDLINRPEKMILEKRIPLRSAIIAHTVLNIAGFAMAAVLAWSAGHLEWLIIQLLCTVLLWFYSTHFKRQFIIGNVVVALLTALTIVVLLVYAPGAAFKVNIYPVIISINDVIQLINPVWMLIGYAFFAFMTTWMREIVKDMEDYKGDAEEGCVTMPIKMGLQFSARFTQVLGVITILTLGGVCWYLFVHRFILIGSYFIAAIIAPLVWWCFYLSKANTVQHYGAASKWLKMIMVAGIFSLIIYHFSIPHNI